jgi:subtilisin family serine protease
MKKIKLLNTFIFLVCSYSIQAQTYKFSKTTIRNDWHALDYATLKLNSLSLDKAYLLLKDKPADTVIVAVIDSGIDTTHADLAPIFWRNTKEIPYNLIDDDNNGYVDDVIGWNFLGGPNKENLAVSIPDDYRTFHRFETKFKGKNEQDILPEDKYLFMEWKRAENKLLQKYNSIKENYALYEKQLNLVSSTNNFVKKAIRKEIFNNDDIKDFNYLLEDSTQISLEIWLNIFKELKNQNNEGVLKMVQNEYDEAYIFYNGLTKPPFDHRGQILKDDGYNFNNKNYGNNNLQTHSGYHGTSVATIIGAIQNNGSGINGIAPKVKIMPIRAILGKDEYDKDVALAIRYAVDNGAKVINMSFGKYISPDKKYVDEAIAYASLKNVVIVHAAGNDAKNIDEDFNYPNNFAIDGSLFTNFINVGACTMNNNEELVAPFSNYGKTMVDVFAPGSDIEVGIANNGTQIGSGTSYASPMVAGIAALLMSYFPKLTAAEVVNIIKSSGNSISFKVQIPGTNKKMAKLKDLCTTGKIVNAYNAVLLALQAKK